LIARLHQCVAVVGEDLVRRPARRVLIADLGNLGFDLLDAARPIIYYGECQGIFGELPLFAEPCKRARLARDDGMVATAGRIPLEPLPPGPAVARKMKRD